ncbi:MAG: DNA polymerase III subunit delta [Mariprofundus sp.]|nr:DNA polymerase III subunit delta [Mariprofundus sp.]
MLRLNPDKLLPAQYHAYYLFGEDHDALLEAAELLLEPGHETALCMRLDINELARFEEESRNQGLFGPSCCYALVRNAQSANPKQADHLLRLIEMTGDEHRLIICAPGMDWKKALHKKMKALPSLPQCEFRLPDEAGFRRWLDQELTNSSLNISPEAIQWMAERLFGMRLAARQVIERLCWYDNGSGTELGIDIVAELLGERAPNALEDWCHAVAMRKPGAVRLAMRLLREQQVAEVQMISWLGTRMQQILMYRWFQSQRDRNPMAAAKVFGEARQKVADESRCWRGAELTTAVSRIVQAEKLVKGASLEDKYIVIERLTLDLIDTNRLVAMEKTVA